MQEYERMTIAVVYTRSHCQPCKATIRALEASGAIYETEALEGHTERFKAMGYTQAPIVEVVESSEDGEELIERWGGFKPDKIKEYFTN